MLLTKTAPHNVRVLPVPSLKLQLGMPSFADPCPCCFAKVYSGPVAPFCIVCGHLSVKTCSAIRKH